MNNAPITVAPATTVEQLLEFYFYQYHHKMYPVVDGETLLGCITLDAIKQIPREQWPEKTVRDLYTPCSDANTVSPDTDTARLIARMIQPGATSRYMVVEDGHLLGMISLKDLREYVAMKLELEPPNA